MNRRWVGAVVIVAMFVFSAVVYGGLPDRVPTHWNLQGEADGWSGRFWGAFLMPVVGLAIWLFMPVLRRIDPRAKHYERFDETFWLIVNVLVTFLGALHVLSLGVALGWPLNITRMINVTIGLMLMALGNYLPRIRSNWWMGIRTPWTLESERVWRETHRIAGYTFVAAGVITLLTAFLPTELSFTFGMVSVAIAALIPTVYSFIAWRREKNETRAGPAA